MIIFFQEKCHYRIPTIPKDDELLLLKAVELENTIHEEKTISNSFQMPKLDSVLGDVTNMAVDAISKEIKYEAFAEKEEVDREDQLQKKDRLLLEENKERLVKVGMLGMSEENGTLERSQGPHRDSAEYTQGIDRADEGLD